jgi:hypothetical protein
MNTPEHDDRRLEELTLTLEADPPTPDAAFAAMLDERVRNGFPRPARRSRLAAFRAHRLAVLGAAASTLAALAIGVALVADGGEDGGTTSPDLRGMNRQLSGEGAAGDATTRSVAPAPGGGFEPGARERRIERSASLTIAAPGGKLDTIGDEVTAVTDRHGGFVLSSSLSTGSDDARGTYDLRVPAVRLQAALKDLAELGTVRSRTQSGRDVTRDFVTAADRLEAARAERRSLLRRLERADTDAEAESIRIRLDRNAGEIRGLRAQIRDLRLRTDYAAVAVTLEADGDSGGGGAGDDGFGAALDDALESLEGALALTIRALGVLLPLTLALTLLGLGAATLRRRRRESALGA